jgi:hypothetical protein
MSDGKEKEWRTSGKETRSEEVIIATKRYDINSC